jgi:pimeloyl-ACP methyl ester carboxylesterase
MPDESWPTGDPVARDAWLTIDGERTRLVEAGDASAPAVVLLHGWGASACSFRTILPGLAQAGLRGIAIDLRGHGESDRPADHSRYSSGAMVAHVAAVIDALRVRPLVVAGQSMGGAIVLDLAVARPDLVRGAVLISSIGFTRLRRVDVLRRLAVWRWAPAMPGRWSIELVMRRIYGTRRQWTRRDVDAYWSPLRRPGSVAALMALVRHFDFAPRPPSAAAALGGRLRLLFGELDRPVPAAEALEHARRFPGASVTVLPGVGHVPAEEASDEVIAAIVDVAGRVNAEAPIARESDRRA